MHFFIINARTFIAKYSGQYSLWIRTLSAVGYLYIEQLAISLQADFRDRNPNSNESTDRGGKAFEFIFR